MLAMWRPLPCSPLLSLPRTYLPHLTRTYSTASSPLSKVNRDFSSQSHSLVFKQDSRAICGPDKRKRNLHTLGKIQVLTKTCRVSLVLRKCSTRAKDELNPKSPSPLSSSSSSPCPYASSTSFSTSTTSPSSSSTSNTTPLPETTTNNINPSTAQRAPPSKARLYMELGKARLTLGTATMAASGYLAVGRFSTTEFCAVFFGTWILGMSGGAANQIIERDLDRQMARTRLRPLPSGQLSLSDAYLFTAGSGALGMGLLWFGANPVAAGFGAMTWAAYLAYTVSKTLTVYNTHIGAVSGALPLIIGWTGAGGLCLDFQCLSALTAMWCWQFAHFNVISWQHRRDYLRAGFRMQSGIDMEQENGRKARGGLVGLMGAVAFIVMPVVSVMHGYNSPLFLGACVALFPFGRQMYLFYINPTSLKPTKLMGRSFSTLAVGGLSLLIYLILFSLSSTRWGEDGTKDFFGYSLSHLLPESCCALFSRHCPVVAWGMDNKRMAASHSPTGMDPQYHSQEEMWRVYHILALACPTYYKLPKTVPKIELVQ